MTPESLDKYLSDFGESVSMRSSSGSKQVPVSKLREYIEKAIYIAVERSKKYDDQEENNNEEE